MAADDLTGVRWEVLKHIYILTGIEWELVRFGVDYNQKVHIFRSFHGPFILMDKLFLASPT